MPCMGPSKDGAYLVGDKITDEVLALMKEKFSTERPPEGTGIAYISGLALEWDAYEKRLRETLREMVWTNHLL